jgi:uncharacterized protein YbjT (DUF2867 family)
MKVLVIGGTGTVGGATVRRLVRAGVDTRVMTSSPTKLGSLPEAVEGVLGDLASPTSLESAMREVERVFLVTPLHPREADLGRTAVLAAARVAVRHLVFLSVYGLEAAPHIPHFGSKAEIESSIREAGLPHTVLRANTFYQNDLAFRDSLMTDGVYPLPLGSMGVSRVDVRDIADAAAAALTRPDHPGGRFPVVGPEPWTGQRVAEVWGRVLERQVHYAGDDLDAWELRVADRFPGWLASNLRVMFEFFQSHGLRAERADLTRQAELLDHPPRRFQDLAAEVADAWRS